MNRRQRVAARNRWQRWAWRAATAAALAGLLTPVVLGQGGALRGAVSDPVAGQPPAAPCLPGTAVPVMDSPIITAAAAGTVEYHTQPATSGPRSAFPVAAGVYESPIDPPLTVRAMEHGRVIIHYAPDTGPAEVAVLAGIARRYGADTILAPNPELTSGIALTAWGRIDRFEDLDEDRIVRFVERLRGRYQHGWTGRGDC